MLLSNNLTYLCGRRAALTRLEDQGIKWCLRTFASRLASGNGPPTTQFSRRGKLLFEVAAFDRWIEEETKRRA